MADKIFTNVRLGLKVDTLENWGKSELILKKGEVAFATAAASVGNGLVEPVTMIKIGTGDKTFAQLDWNFYAKASDVLAACKDEATLRTFINTVITDAGVATDEALGTLSGRVTTAEGAIATLNGDADKEGSVAKKIADAIAALDLVNTYAAKEHEHTIDDVTGLSDAIADAKKAGTDAGEALETYKTENDKAVKANADAIDAIKDDENIDSFADVVAELAKKQDTIDESTYDEFGSAQQALLDAKDYTDSKYTATNKKIENLDVALEDLETNVGSQITTAVNAEKERAEGVEGGLQDAIDAINDAENGILKQAKDYTDGKDDAIAEAKKAGTDAMEEAGKKVASVTAADNSVTIGGTTTAPTVAAKLSADADNALELAEDGLKVVIPAAAEYSIVKAADSGEYAAVYNLTKDGTVVGTSINIPKDMVVKSGSVVGDEIVLVLNDEANTEIKIAVGSLIEYVTSGSEAGDMVVITVDETTHKVTAAITDGAITAAKLTTELQTAIGKAHSHENADVLAGITADKVAAWDAAEQNAKDYADDLDEAMDERVAALEAIDHEHANKAVLDGIEEADITAWDAKVDSVEAAANSGLKATREGNAVTINFDETITWVFDCGDAEVAAE